MRTSPTSLRPFAWGDPGWSHGDRFVLSRGDSRPALQESPFDHAVRVCAADAGSYVQDAAAPHEAPSAAREETGRPSPAAPRRTGQASGPAGDTARGGYVLAEAEGGTPQVLLIADGSEVHIALGARAILQREGIAARVVAMPCPEWFRQQSAAYREEVLPSRVRVRASVAAGSALGWYQLLGDAGIPAGLEQFGARAPYASPYRRHGFAAERVAATARAGLARAAHREAP